MTTTTPRIYVACLASYNSGILHGRWIDCDQDADDIRAEIAEMLRQSTCPNVEVECPECEGEGCDECNHTGKVPSAEEYAIHDYENFGEWKLSEYQDIDSIAAYAAILDELSEDEAVAFQAWVDNQGANDPVDESSLDIFRDDYLGCFSSLANYVEDYFESSGGYERDDKNWWSPINYVDWERMAHDLQLGGDVWVHEQSHDKVHVFNNH
jgi:antirestriction protein